MSSTGNLIVVSAPSGAGKTTIVRRVLDELDNISFSVSYTTRPPRSNEVHGRDYFFVDRATFLRMMADQAFYEWALVYGDHKGTSRDFVESRIKEGQDVLLDIDVQGAKSVKKLNPEAILIFIMPPSFTELERRLRGRGLDDEAQIRKRLDMARAEMQDVHLYDYVVVNREIEPVSNEIVNIIRANRHLTRNNKNLIETILATFGDTKND